MVDQINVLLPVLLIQIYSDLNKSSVLVDVLFLVQSGDIVCVLTGKRYKTVAARYKSILPLDDDI